MSSSRRRTCSASRIRRARRCTSRSRTRGRARSAACSASRARRTCSRRCAPRRGRGYGVAGRATHRHARRRVVRASPRALRAGTMSSVWSNATETEVYAVALLHAVAMLRARRRWPARARSGGTSDGCCSRRISSRSRPPLHLSALVAAPAAIVLAAREPAPDAAREWRRSRARCSAARRSPSAGVGRMHWR